MTPQQKRIIEIQEDGTWHCPTKELFMKDDRKRYSELRQKGYVFDSRPCELGHNHLSRVFMRKLIGEPGPEPIHCNCQPCYIYQGNERCDCCCPGCDPELEPTQTDAKPMQNPATGILERKTAPSSVLPQPAQALLFTYRGLPIEY